MNRFIHIFLPAIVLITLGISTHHTSAASKIIPTFSVIGVIGNQQVTIQTNDFPADETFDVLMGPTSTRGINGIKTATIYSSNGGSFFASFYIPSTLVRNKLIAIRLQSNDNSGYYAYNWFNNYTWGTSTAPTTDISNSSAVLSFQIIAIIPNTSIKIITQNLPANKTFDVLMGTIGTRAVGGLLAGKISSGTGGIQTYTIPIPAQLFGQQQIAVRLQVADKSGYYAYNWFNNR